MNKDPFTCCNRSTAVCDSRHTRTGIRRQRICRKCQHRWTTLETPAVALAGVGTITQDLSDSLKESAKKLTRKQQTAITRKQQTAITALLDAFA